MEKSLKNKAEKRGFGWGRREDARGQPGEPKSRTDKPHSITYPGTGGGGVEQKYHRRKTGRIGAKGIETLRGVRANRKLTCKKKDKGTRNYEISDYQVRH